MGVKEIFRLNSQHIQQLLADAAFYGRCPAFLYLEESATARCRQYEAEVARTGVDGCRGCDDRSREIIAPAIAEFVRQLRRLQDKHPQSLQALREYLQHKLGYLPQGFSLYYTEQGKTHLLTF